MTKLIFTEDYHYGPLVHRGVQKAAYIPKTTEFVLNEEDGRYHGPIYTVENNQLIRIEKYREEIAKGLVETFNVAQFA